MIELAARIETAFGAALQRMEGVPVLNHALRVEARGFARMRDSWAGVLITPWFMNVMILPDDTPSRQIGTKAMQMLPSGQYEAVWGYEEALGGFWSISLFSPMFEFEGHASAVATADAALIELMNSADQGEDVDGAMAQTRMDMIWAGATVNDAAPSAHAKHAEAPVSATSQISRRALFRLAPTEGAAS